MKPKKTRKVLALNKKTISHLGYGEMKAVAGGFTECCDSVESCQSAECTASFDDYTCNCGSDPVPSWNCMTLPAEETCICEEYRTACSFCPC